MGPVTSPGTVRIMSPVEHSKMLPVSVTWDNVSLLETPSSEDLSVIHILTAPAGTTTRSVCVRMEFA